MGDMSGTSSFSLPPESVDAYARHWLDFQSGSVDFDDEMDEPLDAILAGQLASSDPQRALDVVVRILDLMGKRGASDTEIERVSEMRQVDADVLGYAIPGNDRGYGN